MRALTHRKISLGADSSISLGQLSGIQTALAILASKAKLTGTS